MKRPKMKVTRLLVFMALCCALMVGSLLLPSPTAEAATKATISSTKMTVPVGKMDSKVYWNISSWEISNAQKLTVKNKVKGATYQFVSSNSKVVKVDKAGGYITGVKAGSATITCTQTYKTKKTTVGKCVVTVKNATLTSYEGEFPIGDNGYDIIHSFASMDPLFYIGYRNPDATYTVTSDSKNLTMKEVKYDASKVEDLTDSAEYQEVLTDFIGKKYFYGYQFTAKKAGTYTITVKETYNKKTKTLGTFKIVIKDATIAAQETKLLLGSYLDVFKLINFARTDILYYFDIVNYDVTNEENNVLDFEEYGDYLYLYGNKTGTAEVTIREGSEDGPVLGTVTIVVAEVPCESITLEYEEYTAYVDGYLYIDYELNPWDTTDKVTIESDNPEVLKVEYDEEYEYWAYTPLKVGEANITIKCGNQSVVCKVTVEEW